MRVTAAYLDAQHRARGRFENRIKTCKSIGLGKLPGRSFAAIRARPDLAKLALDLASWLQLATVPSGNEARIAI